MDERPGGHRQSWQVCHGGGGQPLGGPLQRSRTAATVKGDEGGRGEGAGLIQKSGGKFEFSGAVFRGKLTHRRG